MLDLPILITDPAEYFFVSLSYSARHGFAFDEQITQLGRLFHGEVSGAGTSFPIVGLGRRDVSLVFSTYLEALAFCDEAAALRPAVRLDKIAFQGSEARNYLEVELFPKTRLHEDRYWLYTPWALV